MKKTIAKILVTVMSLCFLASGLVACKPNPCKEGHKWSNGELTIAVTNTTDGNITKIC